MPDRGRAVYGAILRGGYQAPPWARSGGGYERGGGTIGDLIGQRGQIEAQRHIGGSDMLAQGLQQAGQQIAGYFSEKAEKQEMAKRDAATMAAIESWDGQDPTQLFAGLQKIRPQDALQYTNTILALRGGERKDPEKELARLGKVAQFMEGQPDEVIQRGWPMVRQSFGATAEKLGIPLPEQWDPQARGVLTRVGEVFGPKKEKSKLTGYKPGDYVLNEDGELVFKAPEKPKEGKVVETVDAQGRPITKEASPEELAAGVPKYVPPKAPREAKDPARMWVLRDGKTVRVTEAEVQPGDQPYAARNTTEKDTSTGKVVNVLDSIDQLSKRINTGSGPSARLSGMVRGRTAGLNLDPDVQEYESLVSGFTPMVARAVGHTGVLTEQDVQSVRALFPSPGDSVELRDRKMAQLRRLLASQEDSGGGRQIRPIPDKPKAPKAGDVVRGYRFKGGNPADPSSWEQAR